MSLGLKSVVLCVNEDFETETVVLVISETKPVVDYKMSVVADSI